MQRAGHTEAGVDLARLAGLYPAAALIEIMNEDGTMARMPQLQEVAKEFDLTPEEAIGLYRTLYKMLEQERTKNANKE